MNEIRRMNLIKTQSSVAPVILKYYRARTNKLKILPNAAQGSGGFTSTVRKRRVPSMDRVA